MDTLAPKITDAGLAAVFNASNTGLAANISHIAFGDGNTGSGPAGYTPSGTETALRNERARAAVGGGRRVAPHEIEVQALLDDGPSFWIREVGFLLEDGTLLALWSDEDTPMAYKTAGVPLAVAYYLAMQGVPSDAVGITVSGPSVNITMADNVASTATEIIRLQRRAVATEVARLTPEIQTMWS